MKKVNLHLAGSITELTDNIVNLLANKLESMKNLKESGVLLTDKEHSLSKEIANKYKNYSKDNFYISVFVPI